METAINKNHVIIKRVIYIWLSLLFTGLLLPIQVRAADEDTSERCIRVASFENTFNYINENGIRQGYGYELLGALAGYTGWRFEYVDCDWSEGLDKIKNDEIDIMGDISYTDERTQEMLFSDVPMGEEKYYLYADVSNTDISSVHMENLNGKRIGVLENSLPEMMLTQWEKKHNLQTDHVNVVSTVDIKEKLENHEIDCFVSLEESLWGKLGISAVSCVGKSNIYFAINKAHPEIKEELDGAMHELEEDNPFFIADLYKKYFSMDYTPILSSTEKAWLTEHGAIRMGFVKNENGVSTMDELSGRMSGAIMDYIQYAADCLGNQELKFNLIGYDSFREELAALKADEIDMIFHFVQNPKTAEENRLACTNTTWTYNLMAVTNKQLFKENDANRVAIPANNPSLKEHIKYCYPQWKILEFDSVDQVAAAVEKKQADCFIMSVSGASEYSENHRFYSVPLSRPEQSSFALNSGNRTLLTILNKTIKAMPVNMLTSSLAMNERALRRVTFTDFLKDNLRLVARVCVAVVALVLIIILGLLRKAKQTASDTEKLNKKLQLALEEAESASQAKTNFLNNMSHDIRTPMNVILGYNQLMKSGLKDPRLLDYQKKIEQSGTLLLSIINNVLDMARIESGRTEIDENYEKVDRVISEIEGVFSSKAREKGIVLNSEVQVTHNNIMCDGTKIREILMNLVSNAMKYTPEGGTVTIKSTELPSYREGYVKIKTEIIDTGIGMSADYLPVIFDSFSREHNTTIGRVAGTGLGMSIVKELVDMMEGTVTVESELGKGSRFIVILQHKIADENYYVKKADVSPDDSKEVLKGKHILLVEDNELNAEIAMAILEENGIKLDWVEDGIQCVSRIEQKPAGTYDMILMDIQMPNMDGYKATQIIRQLADKEKAGIPIVAMTANAFEEDRRKAFSIGMNGHIAKPIDAEKMEGVIVSILEANAKEKQCK